MRRLYCIDASGLHHWLARSKYNDEQGRPLTLAQKPLAERCAGWFAQFAAECHPTHVVICLDGKRNWRYDVLAEYKSTRKAKRRPADEEILAEIAKMPTSWRATRLPVLEFDGFEADDTIAALCNVHAGPECEVVIVSSDKDLMQLVGDGVRQYDPRPNKNGEYTLYDAAAVEQKLGVPPHRVADLLALMGDAADDVPGVEGWGEVTAINAIRQTGSMMELLRLAREGALKSINPMLQHRVHPKDAVDKNGELLQKKVPIVEQMQELELSQQLVALRYDVPVPADLAAFALRGDEEAA